MDIAFFNDRGIHAAQLNGLVGKRVRSRARIGAALKKEPVSKPVRPPAAPAEAEGGDIEARLRTVFSAYLDQAAFELDPGEGFFQAGLASSQLIDLLKDSERTFDIAAGVRPGGR